MKTALRCKALLHGIAAKNLYRSVSCMPQLAEPPRAVWLIHGRHLSAKRFMSDSSTSSMMTQTIHAASRPVLGALRRLGASEHHMHRSVSSTTTATATGSASIQGYLGIAPTPPRTGRLIEPVLAPRGHKEGMDSLSCLVFHKNGDATETITTKAELAAEFHVQQRDLRSIDLSYNSQIPVILSRKDCIIMNMEYVTALISAEKAYLFTKASHMLHKLSELPQPSPPTLAAPTDKDDNLERETLRLVLMEKGIEINGKQEDSETRQQYSADDLLTLYFKISIETFIKNQTLTLYSPFEFRVVESILLTTIQNLDEMFVLMDANVTRCIKNLGNDANVKDLVDLHVYRKHLNNFLTTATEIHDAIRHLLENDADMSAMYLTDKARGHPRKEEEHEEIEMLLEAYFKQIEKIKYKILQELNNIDSAQELLEINLHNIRNQILRIDLLLTLVSCALALGSLIAGIFGMNLINGLETDSQAFLAVLAMIIGLVILIFVVAHIVLRRKGILDTKFIKF